MGYKLTIVWIDWRSDACRWLSMARPVVNGKCALFALVAVVHLLSNMLGAVPATGRDHDDDIPPTTKQQVVVVVVGVSSALSLSLSLLSICSLKERRREIIG